MYAVVKSLESMEVQEGGVVLKGFGTTADQLVLSHIERHRRASSPRWFKRGGCLCYWRLLEIASPYSSRVEDRVRNSRCTPNPFVAKHTHRWA